MSRITRQEVDQIARLARLSLSESEAAAMERDLESILDYAASLETLDLEGVEPTAHAAARAGTQASQPATPVRPDEAAPPLDPALAVANAPASEGSAFVVPRVIDEEGS